MFVLEMLLQRHGLGSVSSQSKKVEPSVGWLDFWREKGEFVRGE